MTHQQRTTQVLAVITFFLIVGGIVLAFPLDKLWYGIGLFIMAMIIILLKGTWAIAVWADNTLHRWTTKNLAPDDGVDITFRIEDEEKEDKK